MTLGKGFAFSEPQSLLAEGEMLLEGNTDWMVTEGGGRRLLCVERDLHSSSPCLLSGTHGPGELVKDTLYLRSCQAHRVVPASCFLRQGSAPELNLRHRGLGPQVTLGKPRGQAWSKRTSEAAAMEWPLLVPILHTPQLCYVPGMSHPLYLGDR